MTSTRKHRSVSQINQYKRCPQSYYLSRVVGAWQRPAAWLGQGSAVHEAGEAWERSGRTMTLEEVQDVFRESYSKHINEACEITPNLDYWFRSGPYRGEADIERRYKIGLEQCEKMLAWYAKHPGQVVWIAPDGTPGIELAFDIMLGVEPGCPVHAAGMKNEDCDCGRHLPIPVRGYIDLVVEDENGDVIVRDNKTGNSPGDDFQLGVYGVALALTYGIEPPSKGDYWMGKSGKATQPYAIDYWTEERVTEEFRQLEYNIAAERFDADPEPSKCQFCDVALSCSSAMG